MWSQEFPQQLVSQQPAPHRQLTLALTNTVVSKLRSAVHMIQNVIKVPVEGISRLRGRYDHNQALRQPQEQNDWVCADEGRYFKLDPCPTSLKVDRKKNKIAEKSVAFSDFSLQSRKNKLVIQNKVSGSKQKRFNINSEYDKQVDEESPQSNQISQILPNDNQNSIHSLSGGAGLDFGFTQIGKNEKQKEGDQAQQLFPSGKKFKDEVSLHSERFEQLGYKEKQLNRKRKNKLYKIRIEKQILDFFNREVDNNYCVKSKLDRILDDDYECLSFNPFQSIQSSLKNNKGRIAMQILREQEKKRMESLPIRFQKVRSSASQLALQKFAKKRSEKKHFTIDELHEMLKKIKEDEKPKSQSSENNSSDEQGECQQQITEDHKLQQNQMFTNLFRNNNNQKEQIKNTQSRTVFSLFNGSQAGESMWNSFKKLELPIQTKEKETYPKKNEESSKQAQGESLQTKQKQNGNQQYIDSKLNGLQNNPPPSMGENKHDQQQSVKVTPLPSPKSIPKHLQTPEKSKPQGHNPQVPGSTPKQNPFLQSAQGLKLEDVIGTNSIYKGKNMKKKDESSNLASLSPSLLGTPKNSMIDESEQPESANPSVNLSSNLPLLNGSFSNMTNTNNLANQAAMMFGPNSSSNQVNPMNVGGGIFGFSRSPPHSPPIELPGMNINPGKLTEEGKKNIYNMFMSQPQEQFQQSQGLFGPDPTHDSSGARSRDRRSRKKGNQDRIS